MRKILLASHGPLAQGMKGTVEVISGEQPELEALCAYTEECPDIRRELRRSVDAMSDGDELIIVTDVLGGSVNTEASQLRNVRGVYVLTGMNLGLVLSLVVGLSSPVESLISQSINEARAQVCRVDPGVVLEEECF